MSKKENFKIERLEIIDNASDGFGLGKHEGQVVFVKNTIVGDVVDVEVFRKKKNYLEALLLQITQSSPFRVEPFCTHFGVCGGCKWQMMDYQAQLQWKNKQVVDALTRIGKVEVNQWLPIVGSDTDRYYRNKLEFTFSTSRWLTFEQMDANPELKGASALGFHVPGRFDKIVQIDQCFLQNDWSNLIRNAVHAFCQTHEFMYFDLIKQTGFMRNLIVRNTTLGELMVIVVFAHEDAEKQTLLLEFIQTQFSNITALLYIINTKRNDTIYDLDVHTFWGNDHIVEQLGHLKFKISPKSFFQTNSHQALKLYTIIKNFAQLTGSQTVYDLYTGTGSIGLFIADKAKKVIGVEYIDDAIVDAKQNAALNNIENCAFFSGNMKDIFTDEFVATHGTPDVVITDPPRDGMHKDVVETLLRIAPKRIVYVSCNPATQARDVEMMKSHYAIIQCQPVDMFPHTTHVENVLLMEKI